MTLCPARYRVLSYTRGRSVPPFTCILSLYMLERPQNLAECLNSIERNTQLPSEIVLVIDGPLSDELEDQIEAYRERLPIRTRRLRVNVGLAKALNAGLEEVRTDWIARMDTDDVCEPTRFAEQLDYIRENPNVGLFGGDILEFRDDSNEVYAARKMPTDHGAITRMMKWRSPFNHMTVMYKRKDVTRIGGYPNLHLKEDYALWIRLASSGLVMGNTGSVLVRARAGREMLIRRGGLSDLRSEWEVRKEFRTCGIASSLSGYGVLALRCLALSLPVEAKSLLYKRLLRTSPGVARIG